MTNSIHYKIEDLQKMRDEREEESLTLEFKSCNELKIGTSFRDKQGQTIIRQREDVLGELTKDVTACLNSAGGTIIYGVREKKSRADRIDDDNAFRLDNNQDNIRPERVIQWLRAHIRPIPTVDVYRVFENPDDSQSPWYLVVEVPQGQQAYMAKDHRFYKRVGATVQPMEQYEVVDVMNRTRAAALDLRIQMLSHNYSISWSILSLNIAITSTNFVASEYGALKLTLAYPLMFRRSIETFRHAHVELSTRLVLGGNDVPHANSIMARWGAHSGNVIFPGDWYNFYNTPFPVDAPGLSVIPNPTYLFEAELFTVNSQSKKTFFAIRQHPSDDDFELVNVSAADWDSYIASFWETYHKAWQKLQGQ